jgi:hypothetical protein
MTNHDGTRVDTVLYGRLPKDLRTPGSTLSGRPDSPAVCTAEHARRSRGRADLSGLDNIPRCGGFPRGLAEAMQEQRREHAENQNSSRDQRAVHERTGVGNL